MDLKRSTRVIVNLKDCASFTVFCDKIEFVKNKHALCPDFYRFELNGNTVAIVPNRLVSDFEYFEKIFDTQTTHIAPEQL